MAFFSSPTSSPLPPSRREWIETRWRWLRGEFGDERARGKPVVVPTAAFFPGEYRPTRSGVRRLFPRVARWMDVEPRSVRLEFGGAPDARRSAAVAHAGSGGGVSGFYRGGCPPRIALHAARFDDPAAVVGTLAHELGHVHLLGGRRVTPETEDHEPLTDLLTVFLGLGVFRAHGVVCPSRPRATALGGGIRVQSTGYLDAADFGYAFALHARLRGESAAATWASYLAPAVKGAFERGLRWLH